MSLQNKEEVSGRKRLHKRRLADDEEENEQEEIFGESNTNKDNDNQKMTTS